MKTSEEMFKELKVNRKYALNKTRNKRGIMKDSVTQHSCMEILEGSQGKRRLSGGESNPGLARDRRGYSPLYYQRYQKPPGIFLSPKFSTFSHFFGVFLYTSIKIQMRLSGIEPESAAWKAAMLTITP
uniref:Uncharacterized protein n=1 Tax=Strongyloides venezuelensis TaxID=75913 RepID=A0A0K0G5D9_STRVS